MMVHILAEYKTALGKGRYSQCHNKVLRELVLRRKKHPCEAITIHPVHQGGGETTIQEGPLPDSTFMGDEGGPDKEITLSQVAQYDDMISGGQENHPD